MSDGGAGSEGSGGFTLHSYFRSSTSYRVRIALNLKQRSYAYVAHHLLRGEQQAESYLAVNPQGLVPALEFGSQVLTQSLAIIEYLDETIPDPPLLPGDPVLRAKVRAFAQVIACDTHPVQNLKILKRLRRLGHDQAAIDDWAVETIDDGLSTCEALVADRNTTYCFGAEPGLADICLVPQLANARRFNVPLRWPRLLAVEEACLALPAFADAAPGVQPDADPPVAAEGAPGAG